MITMALASIISKRQAKGKKAMISQALRVVKATLTNQKSSFAIMKPKAIKANAWIGATMVSKVAEIHDDQPIGQPDRKHGMAMSPAPMINQAIKRRRNLIDFGSSNKKSSMALPRVELCPTLSYIKTEKKSKINKKPQVKTCGFLWPAMSGSKLRTLAPREASGHSTAAVSVQL